MSCTLIAALQNPALFPHPVSEFKLIETHISWVLLTGEFAYKIKKPVNFGFLDFTTLAARKHFCQEELRLNQRLAPDLYLEVLPIGGSEQVPVLGGGGQAIEYALKMREFPQQSLLDAVQARGELSPSHIDSLAAQIAGFHQRTPQVPENHALCTVEAITAPMRQNFAQIRPLLSKSADLAQLEALEGWMQAAITRLAPVLEMRGAQGKIRECHGDLHLGNVILLANGEVAPFDCIEFNEEFRLIDQASDAAFLAMDLESRGLAKLSRRFINAWLAHTGDWQALALLNLYKAYRALVRAKVNLLRLAQEQETSERERILQRYRSYAALAESYSQIPSPFLVILHGLSASGKSHLARQLADETGAVCLRSDVERKRLFAAGKDLYSEQATSATYAELHRQAAAALRAGSAVILDAAYLRRSERKAAQQVAENAAVPFLIASCEAPLALIEQRIEARKAQGTDPSDADSAVVRAQQGFAEALDEEEKVFCLCLDTQQDSAALIDYLRSQRRFL